MSSGFKKQLLQSQAYSGTTKKGDIVVLPPDSEDVILVTKCSGKDSGVVKATLEHAPDTEDANFSIVQSEKVSTSAATTGWGNLKYIDTTAAGTGTAPNIADPKNKTVKANNLTGQTYDIFHDKMKKDTPWTISTWFKSDTQPTATDYSPVLFSSGSTVTTTPPFKNVKYVAQRQEEYDAYGGLSNNARIQTIGTIKSSDVADMPIDWSSDKDWSISFWISFPTDGDQLGEFFELRHNRLSAYIWLEYESGNVIHAHLQTMNNSSPLSDDPWVKWDLDLLSSVDLSDGNWHNITLTSTSKDDGAPGAGTNFICWMDNLHLYVDGQKLTSTHATSQKSDPLVGGSWSSRLDAHMGFCRLNHFIRADHAIGDITMWDKPLTDSEVTNLIYNSGVPKDLTDYISTTSATGLKAWYWTGDGYDLTDSTKVDACKGGETDSSSEVDGDGVRKIYDMTGNGKHLHAFAELSGVYNDFAEDTTTPGSPTGVQDLSSSDSSYYAGAGPIPSFGNGLRMSFTKKLKTDGTWDTTASQTSRFLLSFDGFEDGADYFLGYNTTFTRPVHPKTGAENASADLLDGEWHNIIVSYRGADPAGAVNPHDHLAVCFDGKQMTTTDCVEKAATVTFVNDHFRYTDVSEDQRGTFFLSAGDPFTAAGTNSKYAFQGGFDETSLHTDSWQLSSSPTTGWTSGGFNTMKPNTIYGIDSTRNGSNDAGSPYDLKNPSSIGHPGPTGNSYIEPSASAVGGGLQAYYRWGDTTGDCSTSIHDVQGAIDGTTDRDLAVLYGSIVAGDATDENSAAWDTAVDTVGEGGIEVASTTVPGTAGFSLENVQITCADGLQFFRVNAPKLSNLRVKWTGAGTATSVEASLHYRRRKK